MAVARTCVYHRIGTDLRHLVGSVLDGGGVDTEQVGELEQAFAAYVGASDCHAFATARAAVFHSLKSQGLPPASEIVMPPITIRGMLHAVEALGLKPVFVDLDPDTLVFDPVLLRRAITPRTRAVLLTYLFGVGVDPTEIVSICSEHQLFLIEDFSHSLGASCGGRQLGTFGDVGVYSCSATKTLDAYGGGLAVTNTAEMARRLSDEQSELRPPPRRRLPLKVLRSLLWNLSLRRPLFSCIVLPTLRALRSVVPDVAETLSGAEPERRARDRLPLGAYERFTSRQAVIGLRQLREVPGTDSVRHANAVAVRSTLESLDASTPAGCPGARGVDWQTVVVVDDPDRFTTLMARNGVDVATTNLILLPESSVEADPGAFPVAHRIKYRAMYVPTHPRLSAGDLRRVATGLRAALGSSRAIADA